MDTKTLALCIFIFLFLKNKKEYKEWKEQSMWNFGGG